MKIAWSRKTMTAREMFEELKQERTIAYSTVITIMTRLVKKGYLLELEKRGKAIVFHAANKQAIAVKRIIKKMFHSLVEQYGEEAVAAFVDEAQLHSRKKSTKRH
jgi:predicted transcriptional regulator